MTHGIILTIRHGVTDIAMIGTLLIILDIMPDIIQDIIITNPNMAIKTLNQAIDAQPVLMFLTQEQEDRLWLAHTKVLGKKVLH
jgi:hypothetical protein